MRPPAPVTAALVLLGGSLACAGGGPGGGGAAVPRAPVADDERPAKAPRGGKAGRRDDDEREGKAKRSPRRGGGADTPDPEPAPDPEPTPDPQPASFACHAEGRYRVCDVEGKAATCHDETATAGGPGATRAEAEANAVEACDLHLDTLVSAAGAGRGSAEVTRRCALSRCDD